MHSLVTKLFAGVWSILADFQRLWEWQYLDRTIGIAAILVGVVGIWRAEFLFAEINTNMKTLFDQIRKSALQESTTVFCSYASFSRALQAVDLNPGELPPDGAFALLTAFHFLMLSNPHLSPDASQKLRRDTRKSVDNTALSYVELLVNSGLAQMKPKVE